MARLDQATFDAYTKRIAKLRPTSAYADGYRTGLQRNQFGERTRMEGVASHTLCMNGRGGYSHEWERGYRDGYLGNEPAPKRGAPKGEGEVKDKRITLRVTEAQRAKYDKLGGDEWLRGQL